MISSRWRAICGRFSLLLALLHTAELLSADELGRPDWRPKEWRSFGLFSAADSPLVGSMSNGSGKPLLARFGRSSRDDTGGQTDDDTDSERLVLGEHHEISSRIGSHLIESLVLQQQSGNRNEGKFIWKNKY